MINPIARRRLTRGSPGCHWFVRIRHARRSGCQHGMRRDCAAYARKAVMPGGAPSSVPRPPQMPDDSDVKRRPPPSNICENGADSFVQKARRLVQSGSGVWADIDRYLGADRS